jgi:hypothetical protein
MLQPVPGGEGYRLDAADEELLDLGLQLDRELSSYRQRVRERPSLPKLWAGFCPKDTADINGDGPELAAYAARVNQTPASVLEHLRRECHGLTLYPLAWVSHRWRQAAAIFADLQHFPMRQVYRLNDGDGLSGFHGAAEFDFCRRRRSL